MIVDETGMRLSPSKLEVTTDMPVPVNVEELGFPCKGTGYFCDFVSRYSAIAALLGDLQRNKLFVSDHACKMFIECDYPQLIQFGNSKNSPSNPTVLAFPSCNDPLKLHKDASVVEAGAALA